VGYQKY